MRILNLDGRLAIVVDGRPLDVERASRGRFSSDVQAIYERWDEFREWADGAEPVAALTAGTATPVLPDVIGPPVPRPPQVFAIGLNYAEHVAEGNAARPDRPMVFTKFPASLTGPYADIALPPGAVDYEVELVAVIGRQAYHVAEEEGWAYVAGLTAGQDLSERLLQVDGPAPQQHSLPKSHAGFSPIGPALLTPDEFDDPDDIGLQTVLNGETVQDGRTSDMIFSVPQLVAYLSSFLPLLPGDLIFTGTPPGIGWARSPRMLLAPGDDLVTSVETVGEMRHYLVAAAGSQRQSAVALSDRPADGSGKGGVAPRSAFVVQS